MNINLKKISVSLLASAFLFSVIEMQNVSAFSNDEKEIVLDSNGDETNTTIDEINAIIDLQNEAFVEENFSSVKEYENQLNSLGVQTVTGSELAKIIGEDQVGGIAKVKGATMKTVYSKYTTGGKTYDVMRVLATPTTSSNLYKTGVTALKSNTSAQAKTFSVLKTIGKTVAGESKAGKAISAYDFIKSVASDISSTTTVTSISSSYTWNTAETCSFVYFKSPSGLWVHSASYTKASCTVTVVVPTLKYGTNGAKTAHRTATYTSTFTPAYYDSTSKAYAGYKGSTYISQRIKSVNITGVSGKTVKNVVLTCPYNMTMVN